VLLELGAAQPAGKAASSIRPIFAGSCTASQAKPTSMTQRGVTCSWYILMKGSIVAAAEGYTDAAKRAKVTATRLIEDHRPSASPRQPILAWS
jgi:hypothetical protein